MCILSELDPFFTDFKSNFTKFLDYVGDADVCAETITYVHI